MPVPASLSDVAMAVAASKSPMGGTASAQPIATATIAGNDGPRWVITDPQHVPTRSAPQDFPGRIRVLIERAGSVSKLASRCGVCERTVRNWRDGRSDMPRARCVELARVLRVSPLWLINGEGSMTGDAVEDPLAAVAPNGWQGVDSERLAAALQVLQSYIVLAGGSLNVAQRAEAIVELYGMLAQPGPSDPARLIAFHKTLASHLRSNRQAVLA